MSPHREYNEMADITFCNYMRTVYGNVQQIRETIQSGLLGPPRRIEISQESTGATGLPKNHYQMDPDKVGGLLMEIGHIP